MDTVLTAGIDCGTMDEKNQLEQELFHLARVALMGKQQNTAVLVRRYARRYRSTAPHLAEQLTALLRNTPTKANPMRRIDPGSLPVDGDSRIPLIRLLETPVLETEPTYSDRTWTALQQVVRERQEAVRLAQAGVDATRSVLFTGPPGVGKTLAAKWIARELGRTLAVLDLSAVMSSFLGRTGSNLRAVLDFARDHECILLLDELDAVAKRRDDSGEIGELKRLVTVLLQEIDQWPPSGLLLAATNHADLLDPAVWRRFEIVVEFPLPEQDRLDALLRDQLELGESSPWPTVLSRTMVGSSHSDAVQVASRARRMAALEGAPIEAVLERTLDEIVKSLSRSQRKQLAVSLVEEGLVSQRQACALTGVSRDTIRKRVVESKRSRPNAK